MSSLNLFSYATEDDSLPLQNKESIKEETKSEDPSLLHQTLIKDQESVKVSSVKRNQSTSEQTADAKQVKKTPIIPDSSAVNTVPEAIWKAVLDKNTNRYYYWNKVGSSCNNNSIENK